MLVIQTTLLNVGADKARNWMANGQAKSSKSLGGVGVGTASDGSRRKDVCWGVEQEPGQGQVVALRVPSKTVCARRAGVARTEDKNAKQTFGIGECKRENTCKYAKSWRWY